MTPARYNITITRGVDYLGMVIQCYSDTACTTPVDLTGWTAYAQARDSVGKLLRDFAPVVSDPAVGKVMFPPIPAVQTRAMSRGSCQWDLLLQQPSGVRLGPFLAGTLTISDQPTQND